MTWRGGYHGDTFTPMSVCDPDGGMHALWTDVLAHQVFAPQVPTEYDPAYSEAFEKQLAEHADELAAVIVEPVVQGAGGMRFHDPAVPDRPALHLRPPRRAADLRRDRHRIRSHRRAVRRRPCQQYVLRLRSSARLVCYPRRALPCAAFHTSAPRHEPSCVNKSIVNVSCQVCTLGKPMVCSITARITSLPVASPKACTIRSWLCPPSRPAPVRPIPRQSSCPTKSILESVPARRAPPSPQLPGRTACRLPSACRQCDLQTDLPDPTRWLSHPRVSAVRLLQRFLGDHQDRKFRITAFAARNPASPPPIISTSAK